MAGLSAAEENIVSAWLLQKLPANPVTIAQEWWRGLRRAGVRRQLEVAEGVYQVVSDQASHFRTEFLEVIVVLLILIEIVQAFLR